MRIARLLALVIIAAAASAQVSQHGISAVPGAATKPTNSGSILPGICSTIELYFLTSATAGANLWGCTATNTWTQLTSGPQFVSDGTSSISINTGVSPPQIGVNTTVVPLLASANGFTGNMTLTGTQFSATGATHTAPVTTGLFAAIPATCTVGDEYFATDKTPPNYNCTITNTWTQIPSGGTSGSTLFDYQAAVGPLTGNSADQTLYTTTITGGTIPAGKCARVYYAQKHTGSGNMTDKIWFGATSVGSLVANADATEENFTFYVCNAPGSVTSQAILTSIPFNFNLTSFSGWQGGAYVTSASENTASSVILKATFNGAGTEQMTGRFWIVEVLR